MTDLTAVRKPLGIGLGALLAQMWRRAGQPAPA